MQSFHPVVVADDLGAVVLAHQVEHALVPDLFKDGLYQRALGRMPRRTRPGNAHGRRIRDTASEGAGRGAGRHRPSQHRAGSRQLGGNLVGIKAEMFEHGHFIAHDPLLHHLVVLHQAMRDRARHPVAAGRRAVGPVAGMGTVLEHPVRADETVASTLLPDHILTGTTAAIGKSRKFLQRVLHDIVVIVGLSIRSVHFDITRVVVAQASQPTVDPDGIGPTQNVVARVAIRRVGSG